MCSFIIAVFVILSFNVSDGYSHVSKRSFFWAQFGGRFLCLNFDEFRHLAIFFCFSNILTMGFLNNTV